MKAGASDADPEEFAALYPAARSMSWSDKGGSERAESASVVQLRQVSAGYWSVTVAVLISGSPKHADGGSVSHKCAPAAFRHSPSRCRLT
ncbi:hypothetical protein [Streptomyces sp. NPDC093589]|uniref:hypothetical protein n=1 Tax=Streptomyces sp. NPDC093589 TaxID=3366043 RepID=UPI00380A24FD